MRLFFPQLTLELPGTLFGVKPAQNARMAQYVARKPGFCMGTPPGQTGVCQYTPVSKKLGILHPLLTFIYICTNSR